MADKYLDNLHPSAADTVSNGTQAAPYLTIAYALTQASAGDTIYVGNATSYTVTATNLNVTKSIFFVNWNNRTGAKPTINGGDATRVLNINTANPVVFDGFILEQTRNPVGSYISQSRAACRDVRFRNCHFQGSVGLGAVNGEGGSSGTIIESTCTYDMTAGGFVYTAATGAIESYASGTLRGAAQALFFISNGDSNGADFVLGGTHDLVTTNNYVFRCGSTNSDADITIHSTFYLRSVPSNYSRSTFDIYEPRSFTVQEGAYIDTRNTTLVTLGEVWVRSPAGSVKGTINISGLQIDRGSIEGYAVKVGDEGPSSTAHEPNTYTSIVIDGCLLRDGGHFGTAGTTQTHVIFIGNERKYVIKNNKLIEGAYGIGVKASDEADPSSYSWNNYIEGMRLANMKTKGMRKTRWFNNYVVENSKGGIGLDITENTDDSANSSGEGTIARNNVYVMDTEQAINIDTRSNKRNNDIDVNSFYIPEGLAVASVAGVEYDSLEDLQAAIMVERRSKYSNAQSPNFDDNLLPIESAVEYRSGEVVDGVFTVQDSTGSDTVVLSGISLTNDFMAMRRMR